MKKTKKKRSAVALVTPSDLREQFERLRQHPLGSQMLDDFAAASQFGVKTARVGVAADGNPCVVGHDMARVDVVAESIQHQTTVHKMVIPPLNEFDFKVMLHGAAKGLANELPPGSLVEERRALPAAEEEEEEEEEEVEVEVEDETGHRPSCKDHPQHQARRPQHR
jgi:ribosomal protein L12E/L44/L45/RPP1/RPP2